ncbi:hypothetical protein [Methylocystis sp. ATCC 49242]|nr:hypothetical protein [Methylocystis sp. ATCC 49242]
MVFDPAVCFIGGLLVILPGAEMALRGAGILKINRSSSAPEASPL